ncbi:MAG: hypothetical protein V3V33_00715 [Candidatus Lokiarchaeia archaeon]
MGIDVHKDLLQYCIVSQKHILEECELGIESCVNNGQNHRLVNEHCNQ